MIGKRALVLLLVLPMIEMGAAHVGADLRIDKYNKLIAQQPNNARFYLMRAELHRENKHWRQALADYDQAKSLTDDDVLGQEIRFCLGRMYLQSERPVQAIEQLQALIADTPQYIRAHVNLARAYYQLQQFNMAAERMDEYLRLLKTPSPDAYIERAHMLSALGDKANRRNVKGLEQAIEQFGPIVSIIDKLIDLHVEQGDAEQALARLQQLPQRLQTTPLWTKKKADLYHMAGKVTEAEASYRLAYQRWREMPPGRRSQPTYQKLESELITKLEQLVVVE